MTRQEKLSLSHLIKKLQQNDITGVIDIVYDSNGKKDGEEFELDLNKLSHKN